MQVFRSLDEVPADFGPAVVTVGNFDGVHIAHQQVVSHMAERAHAIGGHAVVVTFEPHPLRILRPDVAPKLLAPLPVKLKRTQILFCMQILGPISPDGSCWGARQTTVLGSPTPLGVSGKTG